MPQKYKVFLENNWVLFTENDSQDLPAVKQFKASELKALASYDILAHLLQLHGNFCLISKDPLNAMQAFFTNFKYVQTAGALVQQHGQDQYLWIDRFEHLDLPKGKIEKGELELEAAIREVQEETGLTGRFEFQRKLGHTYHVYQMKGKSYFKLNHWFELSHIGSPEVVAQTKEGIDAVFWLTANEWKARLNECYAGLSELLQSTC
ncbi:MAG: NUDIX hydrolase [Flavobacteriales bacterium]